MTKENLQTISDNIYDSIDHDNSYIALEEWSEQEFRIRGNKDGIKTFVCDLLEICKSDIDETTLSLRNNIYDSFVNQNDIKFIELTTKKRSEIVSELNQTSRKNYIVKPLGYIALILIVYFFIAGLIFTINLFSA